MNSVGHPGSGHDWPGRAARGCRRGAGSARLTTGRCLTCFTKGGMMVRIKAKNTVNHLCWSLLPANESFPRKRKK